MFSCMHRDVRVLLGTIYYLEAEKALKTARKHKKHPLTNMMMMLHGVSLSIYINT